MKLHLLAAIGFFISWGILTHAADEAGTAEVVKLQEHEPEAWLKDLNAATTKAKELNRPLLIFFHANWSGPSKTLLDRTLNASSVASVIDQQFVKVQVSVDDEKQIQALKVEKFPTVIFCAPDMQELSRQEGMRTNKEMLESLQRAHQRYSEVAIAQVNPAATDGNATAKLTKTPLIITDEIERSPWMREHVASWLNAGVVRRLDEATHDARPKISLAVTMVPSSSGSDPRPALVTKLAELDVPPVLFSYIPTVSRGDRQLAATLVLSADTDPQTGQKILSALNEQSISVTTLRRPTISLWFLKSTVESAGPEGAKDWQRVLSEMSGGKGPPPLLDSEAMFASDVALIYTRKKASTVLSWLKARGLVLEVKTAEAGDSDQILLPAALQNGQTGGELHVERTRNWSWSVDEKHSLRSMSLREFTSSQFGRGASRSQGSSGSSSAIEITRSLTLFEKWRGESTSRPTTFPMENSFFIDVPEGMVAMLDAFPAAGQPDVSSGGDISNRMLHSVSGKFGYLPLLVIENHAFDELASSDLIGTGAAPELAAPDRASPIRFGQARQSVSALNDLRNPGPLTKLAQPPAERPKGEEQGARVATQPPTDSGEKRWLEVYQLKTANPRETAKSLNAIMPGVVVNEDDTVNRLHIVGTAKQHEQVRQHIALMDSSQRPAEGAAGAPSPATFASSYQFKIIKLDNADAVAMAGLLAQVIRTNGFTAVADARTNSVLVTSPDEDTSLLAEAVLAKLDSEKTTRDEANPFAAMRGGPAQGAKPLAELQRAYMDKEKAAAGVAQELRALIESTGAEPEQVGRFASDGFFTQSGRDESKFVDELHKATLGRSPKVEEQAFWNDRLRKLNGDRGRFVREYLAAIKQGPASSKKENVDPREAALRETLAVAVRESFAARQAMLAAELEALKLKIAETQRNLDVRSKAVDQIVARRVEDLLNPQLKWEDAATAAAPESASPLALPTRSAAGASGGTSQAGGSPFSTRSSQATGSGSGGYAGGTSRSPRGQTVESGAAYSRSGSTGSDSRNPSSSTSERKPRRLVGEGLDFGRAQRLVEGLGIKSLNYRTTAGGIEFEFEGTDKEYQEFRTAVEVEAAKARTETEDRQLAQRLSLLIGIWEPVRHLGALGEPDVTAVPVSSKLVIHGDFAAIFEGNERKRLWRVQSEKDGQYTFTTQDNQPGMQGSYSPKGSQLDLVSVGQNGVQIEHYNRTIGVVPAEWVTEMEKGASKPPRVVKPIEELLRGTSGGAVRRQSALGAVRNPSDYLELVEPYAETLTVRDRLLQQMGATHPEMRQRAAEFERAAKAVEFLKKEYQAEVDAAAGQVELRRAELSAARVKLETTKSLYEKKVVSRSELQLEELALQKAETQLQTAESRLKLFQSTKDELFPATGSTQSPTPPTSPHGPTAVPATPAAPKSTAVPAQPAAAPQSPPAPAAAPPTAPATPQPAAAPQGPPSA